MNHTTEIIDHSIDFLKSFNLEVKGESDINDLKILHQTPAIAVVGLVSRGKSTLVNKLIGIDLLPTGPNPVTFGNGFLKSGPLKATGLLPSGKGIDLPTEPPEFNNRARRHESQDIIDFEYSGALRLPDDTMLIDTKGLDEVATNFSDNLLELERSWATQGAMFALLVTSVPPGMSAQDARLFQALREHFGGNVLVVVKQTDSSLTPEELHEAASVWSGHGANVVTISDDSPKLTDSWGTGPLSDLENRLSAIWASSSSLRETAAKRLTTSLAKLAERLEVPHQNSKSRDEELKKYWSAIVDMRLPDNIRIICRNHLKSYYAINGTTPINRMDLQAAIEFAEIGSDAAVTNIRNAIKGRSKLREQVPITELLDILRKRLPGRMREIFRDYDISTDDEFLAVSLSIDVLYIDGDDWTVFVDICLKYASKIKQEFQIAKLLQHGGDVLAPFLIPNVMSIWRNHLDSSGSRLADERVINEAFESKRQTFASHSSAINRDSQFLIGEIVSRATNWGETEFSKYENRWSFVDNSSATYATVSSILERQKELRNPFNHLAAQGERIAEVIDRLNCLAELFDDLLQNEFKECQAVLGSGSQRQTWASRVKSLANYNFDNRQTYLNIYGWAAVAFIIFLLISRINHSTSGAIFSALAAQYSWFCWYRVSNNDPLRISPFSENREIPSLQSQLTKKYTFTALTVGIFAITSAVGGAYFQNQVKSDSERVDPIETFSPISTEQTFEPEISTSTISTTTTTEEDLSLLSDDLLEDLIQDGRGQGITEISLPSTESGSIGYAFKLKDKWFNLPSQMSGRYCWVDAGGVESSCDTTRAIRFSQVTDEVIYSTLTAVPETLPSGSYRLRISIDGLDGTIDSLKTLSISQGLDQSSGSSPEVSLPYLTSRNRYWNADCPRLMEKNEFLPLKLCHEGRGVRRVQFLLGLEVDGYFGNTTHNAVLDFQYAKGLPLTGVVDRQTWYELDHAQNGPGTDLNGDGLVTPDEFR